MMSHLNGKIDSVTMQTYLDWNFTKQEGIGLLQTVKTFYNKKGYITKVEETSNNKSDSIALRITNYTYNPKQQLIETETLFLDSIGKIRKTQTEKLVNSVANANTWKVGNDMEVRTFDNDTESIAFLTDSGTVEPGLTYYKKYTTNGQLLQKRISSRHIAILDNYEYNPTSGFLLKETGDQSYFFSEIDITNTYLYQYISKDKYGNWKLRIKTNEDNSSKIYQTQTVYYKK